MATNDKARRDGVRIDHRICAVALTLAPLLFGLGCRADSTALVVATPWPPEALEPIEDAFDRPIRWVRLDPWDDPARLWRSGRPVDLVLGWPADRFVRLADLGALDGTTPPRQCRRFAPTLDRATGPTDTPGLVVPLGDPRLDPVAADSVRELLDQRGFDALADELVSLQVGMTSVNDLDEPALCYGAVPRNARRPEAARALLDLCTSENDRADPSSNVWNRSEAGALSLATLAVGAVATDAGPEFRAAVLDQGVEPRPIPPWPPASIPRLATEEDGPELLATLAAQLVDGEAARSHLEELWDRPPAAIDRATLRELDRAGLTRSPRFRAWLAAEWTAWALAAYRGPSWVERVESRWFD